MTPNSHRKIQNLLQAGDPLSEADQQALQELMQDCPECRTYAQAVDQLSRELPKAFPSRFLTTTQVRQYSEELRARLKPRQQKAANARIWQRLAWAGLVVVLIFGVVLLGSSLPAAGPSPRPRPPATTALSPTDLPSPTTSPTDIPTATIAPPTAYSELQARLEAWKTTLLSAPGWIHQQQRILPGGGSLPDGRVVPDPYIMDEWYQVDVHGKVSAAVNRMLDETGEVYQVTVYRNGAWTNLTFGGDSIPEDYTFNPAGDVLQRAAQADRLESGELYFEGSLVGDQFIIITGDTRLEVLLEPESGKLLSLMTYTILPEGLQFKSSDLFQVQEWLEQPPIEILALLEQESTAYQPPEPQGTPVPADYDPARHTLSVTLVPGDDNMQPSFWFGDLYTEDYLLGRVDFGGVPGGYCDRSFDGAKIAFTYQTQNDDGVYIGRLHWLDLHDIQTVHKDLPDINLLSQVSWSPMDERLAFSGCDEKSGICSVYIYQPVTRELVVAPDTFGTGMPIIWKPLGDQLAFLGGDLNDNLILYVIDVASGATLYTAPYDWDSNQAVGNAEFNHWGVAFPRGGGGLSGCAYP